MKIALVCKSILLEKTLKIFLKPYMVSIKKCDFVITDSKLNLDKPLFIIGKDGAHLPIPFSKASLMLALEEFSTCINGEVIDEHLKESENKIQKDFGLLEEKINLLTEKFRKDLMHTIKSHYEKV